MRSKIVPISNIMKLSEASNALINRAPGMPGMGLIEGQTGYGKSTAAAWQIVKVNGAYVRAIAVSTPSSLLEAICKELGIARRATHAATIEDIVQKLSETGRPLFVDEADYLVSKHRLIDTLRDIHDLSSVPVVLIGMHGFRRKITSMPQLTGRIAQWVDFEASTIEDAQLLARELAEVTIAADLVRKLHAATHGSVRLIVNGLSRIEHFAKSRGLDKIGLGDWPTNADFFVGTAPGAKKAPAQLAAVN